MAHLLSGQDVGEAFGVRQSQLPGELLRLSGELGDEAHQLGREPPVEARLAGRRVDLLVVHPGQGAELVHQSVRLVGQKAVHGVVRGRSTSSGPM